MKPVRSLLLLLLVASCAPQRGDIGMDARSRSAGELLTLLNARRAELSRLTGRGEITFESPERSGSAFFRFALRKSDSLLVRLQGPFGIDVGSLLLTREGFLFYNAIDNRVLSGEQANRQFRALIPVSMGEGDLIDLFAGHLPLPHDSAGVRMARADDELLLLHRQKGGAGSVRTHVDPEEWTVTRVEILDSTGATVGDAEALEFHEIDGILLPRRIRASMENGERALAIYFTSQTPNGPPASFEMTIPPSARRSAR